MTITNAEEKIQVRFEGGECRDATKGSCNYMLATATDGDGDEIELYAEAAVSDSPFDNGDDNGFDDYSYPILKAEITRQAVEHGIDPARLKFHLD